MRSKKPLSISYPLEGQIKEILDGVILDWDSPYKTTVMQTGVAYKLIIPKVLDIIYKESKKSYKQGFDDAKKTFEARYRGGFKNE